MDFVRELISTKIVEPKKVLSTSDVTNMSKSDFKENVSVFTKQNTKTIEKLGMGQIENEHSSEYRKCLITTSKHHEVVIKMTKVGKGSGGTVNMWFLNQKISGLVFVKPNIPALKYGRDMEIEVANTFNEFINGKHKDIKLSDCEMSYLLMRHYHKWVQAQTEFRCVCVVKRLVWKSSGPIQ